MTEQEFRAQAADRWHKSSFSGPSGGCIFIARVGDTVGIIEADDPTDTSAPVVLTPIENFRKFIAGAKAGEFDL
ncbi:DUF397 domain-containing protein [Marinitenerispora sediminis]|uniref:DUF397 domain-containing protein n=1 Tax=Marinitenerispora sediminis TaxID=1931232 RepID=A0A368T2T6_9ACTN|nr:DUF397 domain-containing protein [Marinitenerispora sediminis]RCV52187.1 DUF397 domain-containing protein [Marinitenerispora sediminis]RCV53096.1 DUF397 domain-containing protein [Marinitenerispora sediminis]RCV56229.1 DUF397 domain-containing protein [Marinitenerispora sediminis]